MGAPRRPLHHRLSAAYGDYCEAEADIFRQLVKPGATVVEAGANIGTHTVMLVRACAPGRLIAFEPQQRVFQLLCANQPPLRLPAAR